MVLVRMLERKDAASLVVAIAGGVVVSQLLLTLANALTSWLFDGEGRVVTFKDDIFEPIVAFLLAMVLLEGLLRLGAALRSAMRSSR